MGLEEGNIHLVKGNFQGCYQLFISVILSQLLLRLVFHFKSITFLLLLNLDNFSDPELKNLEGDCFVISSSFEGSINQIYREVVLSYSRVEHRFTEEKDLDFELEHFKQPKYSIIPTIINVVYYLDTLSSIATN